MRRRRTDDLLNRPAALEAEFLGAREVVLHARGVESVVVRCGIEIENLTAPRYGRCVGDRVSVRRQFGGGDDGMRNEAGVIGHRHMPDVGENFEHGVRQEVSDIPLVVGDG